MKLRQQKLCKMPRGRVRRKVASALVLAMSATTVFPAFAGPPPGGIRPGIPGIFPVKTVVCGMMRKMRTGRGLQLIQMQSMQPGQTQF